MAYLYRLAADVLPDQRAMDPWVQEAFLDDCEALVASPPARLRDGQQTVRSFYHSLGDADYLVTYRVVWSVTTSTASVVGLELAELPRD